MWSKIVNDELSEVSVHLRGCRVVVTSDLFVGCSSYDLISLPATHRRVVQQKLTEILRREWIARPISGGPTLYHADKMSFLDISRASAGDALFAKLAKFAESGYFQSHRTTDELKLLGGLCGFTKQDVDTFFSRWLDTLHSRYRVRAHFLNVNGETLVYLENLNEVSPPGLGADCYLSFEDLSSKKLIPYAWFAFVPPPTPTPVSVPAPTLPAPAPTPLVPAPTLPAPAPTPLVPAPTLPAPAPTPTPASVPAPTSNTMEQQLKDEKDRTSALNKEVNKLQDIIKASPSLRHKQAQELIQFATFDNNQHIKYDDFVYKYSHENNKKDWIHFGLKQGEEDKCFVYRLQSNLGTVPPHLPYEILVFRTNAEAFYRMSLRAKHDDDPFWWFVSNKGKQNDDEKCAYIAEYVEFKTNVTTEFLKAYIRASIQTVHYEDKPFWDMYGYRTLQMNETTPILVRSGYERDFACFPRLFTNEEDQKIFFSQQLRDLCKRLPNEAHQRRKKIEEFDASKLMIYYGGLLSQKEDQLKTIFLTGPMVMNMTYGDIEETTKSNFRTNTEVRVLVSLSVPFDKGTLIAFHKKKDGESAAVSVTKDVFEHRGEQNTNTPKGIVREYKITVFAHGNDDLIGFGLRIKNDFYLLTSTSDKMYVHTAGQFLRMDVSLLDADNPFSILNRFVFYELQRKTTVHGSKKPDEEQDYTYPYLPGEIRSEKETLKYKYDEYLGKGSSGLVIAYKPVIPDTTIRLHGHPRVCIKVPRPDSNGTIDKTKLDDDIRVIERLNQDLCSNTIVPAIIRHINGPQLKHSIPCIVSVEYEQAKFIFEKFKFPKVTPKTYQDKILTYILQLVDAMICLKKKGLWFTDCKWSNLVYDAHQDRIRIADLGGIYAVGEQAASTYFVLALEDQDRDAETNQLFIEFLEKYVQASNQKLKHVTRRNSLMQKDVCAAFLVMRVLVYAMLGQDQEKQTKFRNDYRTGFDNDIPQQLWFKNNTEKKTWFPQMREAFSDGIQKVQDITPRPQDNVHSEDHVSTFSLWHFLDDVKEFYAVWRKLHIDDNNQHPEINKTLSNLERLRTTLEDVQNKKYTRRARLDYGSDDFVSIQPGKEANAGANGAASLADIVPTTPARTISMASHEETLLPQSTQFRKLGRFMRNQGNTCYADSLIFCLVHLPPLLQALRTTKRETCSAFNEELPPEENMATTFVNLVKTLMVQGTDEPNIENKPNEILSICQKFQHPRAQQDAFEAYMKILGTTEYDGGFYHCARKLRNLFVFTRVDTRMHKDEKDGLGSHSKSTIREEEIEPISIESAYFSKGFEEALRESMQSRIRTKVRWRCDECGFDEHAPDDIKNDKHKLYEYERTVGRIAYESFAFQETGPILCVRLARFNDQNQKDTSVLKGIPRTWVPPSKSGTYTLWSFIVHVGEYAFAGHYVAYSREYSEDYQTLTNAAWHYFDDSGESIIPAHDNEVNKALEDAYMLFYVRNKPPTES